MKVRQRSFFDEETRMEKLKNGVTLEEWEKPENAAKMAQKDIDARWAKKNNEMHFGYKDHVKCDAESTLMTNYGIMDAAVYESQIRCRIEHVFGFMTNSMNGIRIRSIGIDRAWFNIGLMNLVYNFCRYEFLKRASA